MGGVSATTCKPQTTEPQMDNVYELPSLPSPAATTKPRSKDGRCQRPLVVVSIAVSVLAGCLLGLLVLIALRMPWSRPMHDTACPEVACPQVVCPAVECPAVECPAAPGTSMTSCDEGFLHRPGSQSCYKVVKRNMIWSEAVSLCAGLGAYLVEIGSRKEQDFMETLTSNEHNTEYWLGARRMRTASTTFIWSHSKQVISQEVGFTNWHPNQPTTESVRNVTVLLTAPRLRAWHDTHPSNFESVICEKASI